MVTEDPEEPDEEAPTGEFFVPATFQFSKAPGRIERILVGLFEEDGEIEARRVTDYSMPEFYVPAMFQTSTDPGRIERFLQALFEGGDDQELSDIPEEFREDFYLPASNPDGYSRLGKQKHASLVPVSERSHEGDNRGEPGN
jgi:hypothetical protein